MVRIARKATKKFLRAAPDVAEMVESIVGCKWSLHVLTAVRQGINRPGAIVKSTPGLTTKVMNERLNKMVRFGIFEKISYPEVPPRVEYVLTAFGRRFVTLIDEIDRLRADVESGKVPWE